MCSITNTLTDYCPIILLYDLSISTVGTHHSSNFRLTSLTNWKLPIFHSFPIKPTFFLSPKFDSFSLLLLLLLLIAEEEESKKKSRKKVSMTGRTLDDVLLANSASSSDQLLMFPPNFPLVSSLLAISLAQFLKIFTSWYFSSTIFFLFVLFDFIAFCTDSNVGSWWVQFIFSLISLIWFNFVG